MPGVIAGILAIALGIGVLVVRYRRRERLIAFMPLVSLGFGLIVIGTRRVATMTESR